MIAKQLESLLTNEAERTDLSRRSAADLVQRFQSLRGFGLLPKGRGKNAQHLNLKETVAGILSIVSEKPGHAGVAAKILMKLKPVGGANDAFFGVGAFGDAMVTILSNDKALESIIEVRASCSEIYNNSNGRCAIWYRANDSTKVTYFVSELATSLMRKGAEKSYDPNELISSTLKETVFLKRLFSQIVGELNVEYSAHTFDHLTDPNEEKIEIQREERIKKLGITNRSNFLNIAVDTQVTWPREETVAYFAGKKLILMPRSRQNDTSIHVDLSGQGLTSSDARTLVSRFLSILTWCDDQFCILQEGTSGSTFPVPTSKRELAFITAYSWFFDRKLPNTKEKRMALALYRQGRNAEQNYLVSYAVLSYYKVIEVLHNGKAASKKWFKDVYPSFRSQRNIVAEIEKFEESFTDISPHEYIYKACRVAVAHVSGDYPSDPDDSTELRRLHIVASVMRELARYFMINEMSISDSYIGGE